MEKTELRNLFRAIANVHTPAGDKAFRDFAAAIDIPILQEIKLRSVIRGLFSVEELEPGAQAMYPVADDFDIPVWVLPRLGAVAHNFIEGFGEDVYVPTFQISASAEWKISYAREGRFDIAQKAVRKIVQTLAEYEEESGWKVIVPAGTSNFTAAGLLPARSAPVNQVEAGKSGAGFLSKELINKMAIGMKRADRTLTDLYISPEDAADIREWTDTDVDPITRREIFQAAGMGKIWNIQIHEIQHLGGVGKFNINDNTSDWGVFLTDGGAYNNYTVTNGNVVDANGEVTTAGETQIWGFDTTVNDSLVMPIKQAWESREDPTLWRSQKQGIYGWEELGMACLDSRMLCMGVIDRSL